MHIAPRTGKRYEKNVLATALTAGLCLVNRYSPAEIFVTENGVDVPGEASMSMEQALDDQFRINFFRTYLDNAVQAVVSDGVPLTKYFVWSLLDNFEWVAFSSEVLIKELSTTQRSGAAFEKKQHKETRDDVCIQAYIYFLLATHNLRRK